MMTPPVALISDDTPLTVATTPVTVPLVTVRLSIGVLSQTGTPALISPARRPAAEAWPMVSGVSPSSAASVPRARQSASTSAPWAFTAAIWIHL